MARKIRPALDAGEWVVCARYLDSSLAYQGGGYGLDLDTLRTLQAFATDGLTPDLTILIDVPVDIGLRRKRKDRWNRFENTESAAFFERVRRTYLDLAAAEPDRFRVLDGSGIGRPDRCGHPRAGGSAPGSVGHTETDEAGHRRSSTPRTPEPWSTPSSRRSTAPLG